ncbi:MAG: hypothetical protein ACRDTC_14130 [Pseudonocardiaceae bacterium]
MNADVATAQRGTNSDAGGGPAVCPIRRPGWRAGVPARLPADVDSFTGRTAELAALDRFLPDPAPTTMPPSRS